MKLSVETLPEIVGWSAGEIAERIARGEVSAAEVVEAHIARIEAVNHRLNAVVIPLFDSAREQAARVDQARGRSEALGPLAGVPVTIKECFFVAGTPSNLGVQGLGPRAAADDAVLVKRLRRAGAVVLGKTNLPQMMIMNETDSPVYGRCNNPWNLERSPGGSSGGEAAIIAAGGSPLGLGNDLGGSIRQPAHSCGIAGLKPTTRRLTCEGSIKNFHGMESLLEQAGPLARRVDDLALALGVLAAPGLERDDPQMAPVPWRDPNQVSLAGMRIAYWDDDGYFPAAPALRRAVRAAAEALRAQGAIVEPFTPPSAADAMEMFFRSLSADGAADVRRMLGRSARDWRVSRLLQVGRIPARMRPLVGSLLTATGQRRLGRFLSNTGALSADSYWQLVQRMRDWVQRFMQAFYAGGFSAAICPPHALPALRHGSTDYLAQAGSYCMLGNVLGWPAGVVPLTRVQPGEESDRPRTADLVERRAIEVEAGSAGLPVGVQVAAPHWREDIVLAVMGALERQARQQPDFPNTPIG